MIHRVMASSRSFNTTMDIDFFLAAGHLNLTVLVKVMRLHCSFIQEEIQAEVTVIDIGFCCVCRCACVRACGCVCVCVCVCGVVWCGVVWCGVVCVCVIIMILILNGII